MGSGSWVAQNWEWLRNRTVAYVDIMGAVMGSQFFAKASPLLASLVRDVTQQQPSVNQSVAGQTVLDSWGGSVVAGDGGDALSFMGDGIPMLTLGFGHDKAIDPAFHWHSAFDTVQWMDRFADPSWEYHVRAAQIWGLMAARHAGDPVLPFNMTEYVTVVRGIVDDVQDVIEGRHDGFFIGLEPLNQAVAQLYHAAIEFDAHVVHLRHPRVIQPRHPKFTALTTSIKNSSSISGPIWKRTQTPT